MTIDILKYNDRKRMANIKEEIYKNSLFNINDFTNTIFVFK